MILIKDNIERIVSDDAVVKELIAQGYTVVGGTPARPADDNTESHHHVNMSKAELIEAATKWGIEDAKTLTKKELIECLTENGAME